ncbi:MAG TPA: hypothetical protein VK085_08475 [Pseudogracilibacillus sp.]|nr:hypothetical protein [Pseudogracilibacillus sp.]
MNKKLIDFISIFIKIATGILVLFVPSISNTLTMESNTVGSYATAYFLATCAALSFTVIYIGTGLSIYASKLTEK